MRNLRNMPGERETRQFRREFLVHNAAAELRRLARNVYGRERLGRMILEEIAQLPINRFRVDIADDDKGKIVRHVTRLVILHHLIAGELVVDIDMADHRQPIRMALKRGREK